MGWTVDLCDWSFISHFHSDCSQPPAKNLESNVFLMTSVGQMACVTRGLFALFYIVSLIVTCPKVVSTYMFFAVVRCWETFSYIRQG